MHADLETIVCKFGGDPTICLHGRIYDLRKKFTDRQRDGQTDDGRRAITLAHWNKLKTTRYRR